MSTLDTEIEDLRQRITALNLLLGELPSKKNKKPIEFKKYDSPKLQKAYELKQPVKERSIPSEKLTPSNNTKPKPKIENYSPLNSQLTQNGRERPTPKSGTTEVGLSFSNSSLYSPFQRKENNVNPTVNSNKQNNREPIQLDSDSDDMIYLIKSPNLKTSSKIQEPKQTKRSLSKQWYDSDSGDEIDIDKIRKKVEERRNQKQMTNTTNQKQNTQPQKAEPKKEEPKKQVPVLQPLRTEEDIEKEFHSLFPKSPTSKSRDLHIDDNIDQESDDFDPIYYENPEKNDYDFIHSESDVKYSLFINQSSQSLITISDEEENQELPRCPTQESDDEFVTTVLNKIHDLAHHALEEEEEEEEIKFLEQPPKEIDQIDDNELSGEEKMKSDQIKSDENEKIVLDSEEDVKQPMDSQEDDVKQNLMKINDQIDDLLEEEDDFDEELGLNDVITIKSKKEEHKLDLSAELLL